MGKKILVGKERLEGQPRITLRFGYDQDLIEKARLIPGARWSRDASCWHMEYSKPAWKRIRTAFKGEKIEVEAQGGKQGESIQNQYVGAESAVLNVNSARFLSLSLSKSEATKNLGAHLSNIPRAILGFR